jgi:hypothetical protein
MSPFAQIAIMTSQWLGKARKFKGFENLDCQKKLSPAEAGLGRNSV